ncbi:MlaD family protein [Pseudoroseicyclus aestuarii]|uniref:Paraquat-inducible protein B n=1 Tax=Pseudoroseicyclus aestuarii TaxID=1795041 RepID=A0A318T6E4_9RHOB|nr:MlaD family protein [Pseudoroseicyclus aestuarii]PYE86004.1 paraquat-inducible protein B [Pseudoroseicyclus aestuarii]
MSDAAPEVPVQSGRRSLWQRVSIVWVVPIAALIVALGIAWNSWREQGPLIEIVFLDGAGVTAGETELRFRDVTVGLVEEVGFTEDLDQVRVSVRIDRDVAPYVDEEAKFWIVRPEVSTRGVSGLETVLSGVYLQGQWDTVQGEQTSEFEGLTQAPLLGPDRLGLSIVLRASGGLLSSNSPLLYKGVEVGRIGEARVSADGFYVEAPAVIYAPYDNLVTEATRFWDTSGFSVSLGSQGAEINFDSIASLVAGGLTFDTFVSGAELAEEGDVFEVFDDEEPARNSVFQTTDQNSLNLSALFDGNVAGLTIGSLVEINGIRIGTVAGLTGLVDRARFGDTDVRLQTILQIRPSALGLDQEAGAEEALDFLTAAVGEGLRARLVTGNLLTGGLKVQLFYPETVQPASLDLDAEPFPALPTVESDIVDVQATAQGTLDRINDLPIEALLQNASDFLDNAAALLGSDDLQRTPAEVRGLLADVRGVVGSDGVQQLPSQLSEVMAGANALVADVDLILQDIDENEAVPRVLAAVDALSAAASDVNDGLEGLPALLSSLTAVADEAGDLPLDALVSEIAGLAQDARSLVGSEAIQAVPERVASVTEELDGAVQQLRGLLGQVSDQQGVARALAAVDSAGAAADELTEALDGVPALVARIDSLAAQAGEMDLPALSAEVQGLAADARGLVGSEATQALPAQIAALTTQLNGTLGAVRGLVTGITDQDGVARLLAAVDSAQAAASGVEGSIAGVPALIDRLDAVAAQAQSVDLDGIAAQVEGLAADARVLVSSEATQALPGRIGALTDQLSGAASEARELIAEVNETGGAERLLAAVDAAQEAARSVSASVDESLAGVPALVARIDAIAESAQAVPLDQLAGRVDALLRDAQAVIGQDSARQLPEELNGALSELRQILSDLRSQGVIDNVNATLVSARTALEQLAVVADTLPQLAQRADALLVSASGTVGVVGSQTEPALRDLRSALRQVSDAAEAVSSLARAIERRPNSLLTGR